MQKETGIKRGRRGRGGRPPRAKGMIKAQGERQKGKGPSKQAKGPSKRAARKKGKGEKNRLGLKGSKAKGKRGVEPPRAKRILQGKRQVGKGDPQNGRKVFRARQKDGRSSKMRF